MVATFGRSLSWPASGLDSFLTTSVPTCTAVYPSRSDVRRRVTVLGSIATTETATIVPSSWKTWVMPTLRPINPISGAVITS